MRYLVRVGVARHEGRSFPEGEQETSKMKTVLVLLLEAPTEDEVSWGISLNSFKLVTGIVLLFPRNLLSLTYEKNNIFTNRDRANLKCL